MDASLYHPLFLTLIVAMCLIISNRYMSSTENQLQDAGSPGMFLPLVLSLILIFWLGGRPISGFYFGDTSNYARMYRQFEIENISFDKKREWVWELLIANCKSAGLSVSSFFTIVAAGYLLTVLWAVKRLLPTNPMLGMLFVLASLSFFTYGTNGIRNGLACHIIILALSFFVERKYIIGTLLCMAAFGIHRSTMLPILSMVAALFFIKNPKVALCFWLVSIPVSLLAGGAITSFFASLGFDDRMSGYTDAANDMSAFSGTGFRWDFLLYSSMPVLMAWYVCVRRQIADNWYNIICTTYCLCNAFWVMVIRASFSNRFAYLSWFLYPIVIAYPLINLSVWEDQDRKTGQILLAYCGFTAFMDLVYW